MQRFAHFAIVVFQICGVIFENEAFLELCQVAPVPAIHTRFAWETDTVDATHSSHTHTHARTHAHTHTHTHTHTP